MASAKEAGLDLMVVDVRRRRRVPASNEMILGRARRPIGVVMGRLPRGRVLVQTGGPAVLRVAPRG